MTQNLFNVILAGGMGSRLWPISSNKTPKQFLQLFSKKSLFQEAVLRNYKLSNNDIIVIISEQHKELTIKQLAEINVENYVLITEPLSKNTGPTAVIAALYLRQFPRANILITPSDHVIEKKIEYLHYIRQANLIADKQYICTLGIKPIFASTEYGYIKAKNQFIGGDNKTFSVENFVEKPNKSLAEEFLNQGNYFWNSGIYMMNVEQFLNIAQTLEPFMYKFCLKAFEAAKCTHNSVAINSTFYAKIKEDSFDNAFMEKIKNAIMLKVDLGWSDMGDFKALWHYHKKDTNGNVVNGKAKLLDTRNSYINIDDDKVGLVLGMDNAVLVSTSDGILLANMDELDNLKDAVHLLKDEFQNNIISENIEKRPWGDFKIITHKNNYKIKEINVKVGQSLSLQIHKQRIEYWVLLEGKAEVIKDEQRHILETGETICISRNEKHRLKNIGDIPLKLIEVQYGDYLEEDDIIRIEDLYGRI